jgi:hypothetical protein
MRRVSGLDGEFTAITASFGGESLEMDGEFTAITAGFGGESLEIGWRFLCHNGNKRQSVTILQADSL